MLHKIKEKGLQGWYPVRRPKLQSQTVNRRKKWQQQNGTQSNIN